MAGNDEKKEKDLTNVTRVGKAQLLVWYRDGRDPPDWTPGDLAGLSVKLPMRRELVATDFQVLLEKASDSVGRACKHI